MNFKTLFFLIILLISAGYFAISLPGTLKLKKEIAKLEKEFWQIAKNPHSVKFDKNKKRIILEYNGKLKQIVKERDCLVKKNHAYILSSWTASGKKKPEKNGEVFYVEIKTVTLVFKPWMP